MKPRIKRWLAAAAVYFEPRVLAILFLGFSSGLPLALTGSTLAAWLKEEWVSLTSIGLFALVGLPYVLKFLWAPLIDAVRVPVLTRTLGRRRAWLVTTQALLIRVNPNRKIIHGEKRFRSRYNAPSEAVLAFANAHIREHACSAWHRLRLAPSDAL